MKKFFLFLFVLIPVFLFAQQPWILSNGGFFGTNIYSFPDTTEMKTAYIPLGNICYLNGYANTSNDGQGWFHVVASTTANNARSVFNHPNSSYRFIRIVDFNSTLLDGDFWYGSPQQTNDMSTAFFYTEDFIGHVNWPASTGAGGGWKLTGDATYDVLNAAGTLGGWVQVAPETGSNNELYAQLGTLGTETYVEFTESNSKQVWLEYNLTPSAINGAANWFVGLGEEGAAAANFIADAGNDIADKDVVGFVVWEGNPDTVAAIFQTAGKAFIDTFETKITAANMTLGIYFDGSTTITWYFNGSAIGSITDLDISLYGAANTFPKAEELSPLIGMKQGAADITLSIDWIKLIAERQ